MNWASWSVEAGTPLSRTDLFALKSETAVVFVPWDKVIPIVGRYLQPTDHYSPHFRVDAFPTAPELEQLKPVATPVGALSES